MPMRRMVGSGRGSLLVEEEVVGEVLTWTLSLRFGDTHRVVYSCETDYVQCWQCK